jgi:hypothetical protein
MGEVLHKDSTTPAGIQIKYQGAGILPIDRIIECLRISVKVANHSRIHLIPVPVLLKYFDTPSNNCMLKSQSLNEFVNNFLKVINMIIKQSSKAFWKITIS